MVKIEHRMQQRTGPAERGEPALEDRVDLAALVERHQGPVDGKAEVGIVSAHNQRIRLVGKIALEETERRTLRRALPKLRQYDPIAGIPVGLAGEKLCKALVRVLHWKQRSRRVRRAQLVRERLLGGRAGDDGNASP